MKKLLLVLAVLMVPGVMADTFTEDFESFNAAIVSDPEQDWYNYAESGEDVGTISTSSPIGGVNSFLVTSPAGVSGAYADFTLEIPAPLTNLTFTIRGVANTQQYVAIQSTAPVRSLVEFYVLCTDSSFPNGCQLNVRYAIGASVGETLIPYSNNDTVFVINIVPNWQVSTYSLSVDGVDDGDFPFFELPREIGRLRINQYSSIYAMNVTFDNFIVDGAVFGAASATSGDVANGIKNFLQDIRFTTSSSKFFFGVLLFVVLIGSVSIPLVILGRDNTTIPSIGFFSVLVALWLVYMEIWPDWVGIALIIVVAAMISFVVRAKMLGIFDASRGPGLVAGSLGYFIIASSFLAFSGYAATPIEVPTGDQDINGDSDEDNPPAGNTTELNFVQQVTNCIFTGAVFTFGLVGSCEKDAPKGKVLRWAEDTIDSVSKVAATIFSYARASFVFLFQLLTFQLPIPVLFNVMIVLPPAAALAVLAIQTIRGVGG